MKDFIVKTAFYLLLYCFAVLTIAVTVLAALEVEHENRSNMIAVHKADLTAKQ